MGGVSIVLNVARAVCLVYRPFMSKEPENLVLELLSGIRADVAGVKADIVETRAELKSDLHSLRADVASDLMVHRKEFGEQIVGLRRAVV